MRALGSKGYSKIIYSLTLCSKGCLYHKQCNDMTMKYLILSLLIASQSLAYTIVAKPNERYANPKINILVSTKGCDPIHRKPETIANFVQTGVDRYWNTVSTSSLRFSIAGFTETDFSSADSMQEMIDQVPWNTIVVACNDHHYQFVYDHGGLGMQSHFQCDDKSCRGLVFVNSTLQSMAKDYDDFLFQGYLSYSLGKAIGIGGSRESDALMYFYVFRPYPTGLHQDDVDAVSFLYPKN